jgi:hypothetical protein
VSRTGSTSLLAPASQARTTGLLAPNSTIASTTSLAECPRRSPAVIFRLVADAEALGTTSTVAGEPRALGPSVSRPMASWCPRQRRPCMGPAAAQSWGAPDTMQARPSASLFAAPVSSTTPALLHALPGVRGRTPAPTRTWRRSGACSASGASGSACSPTRSGPGSGTGTSSPGRRARPHGRRRVHRARSRGPSRRRWRSGPRWRPSASTTGRLRLRGRPSLRRRVGCAERRDAGDPRAAQYDSG